MISLINDKIYFLVYLFTFYSFCGWCLEVSYYFKNEKRFVNRGFLKGPFCPIYGFCIVTLILLLEEYKNNVILLFIFAFFITSFFEYITGVILEKIFKAKWWDYTDDPFNIQGYVCLPYSLLWASGEVLIITVINPVIEKIMYDISYILNSAFFYCIVFYFLLDFSLTIHSLLGFDKFSYPFEFASNGFSLTKVTSISSFYKYKARNKIRSFENVFHKIKLSNKKLIQNFNTKSHNQFSEIIKNIREKIKKY
ncbi:MAG: putative ABC transporter permease [Clostridium sp.]